MDGATLKGAPGIYQVCVCYAFCVSLMWVSIHNILLAVDYALNVLPKFVLVKFTLRFDVLSVSHQAVSEVCSSSNHSITADHTVLDITPERKHTQMTLTTLLLCCNVIPKPVSRLLFCCTNIIKLKYFCLNRKGKF